MLTSLLESLFVTLANGARRPVRPSVPARPSPGAILLGERLPLLPDLPDGGETGGPVHLSETDRMRHVYALGATGCGKTNFLLNLIEGDIEAHRTFCVLDLRGDLVDRILPRLAARGDPEDYRDRLVVLDLRDDSHVVPFNPLLGPGDPYTRALLVLSVLRKQADSWGVQLEETLRNALMALAETGWSLLEIEPLLSEPAFRAQVMEGVSDSYVRAFFGRYGALSDEKQQAWRLPVLNKVTPLLCLPSLRLMFGARDPLSLGPLLDGPPGRVILVSLAVDRLHEAAYLAGGLLVTMLQNAVMARADRPEATRVPVHLYVDEFETMATDRFEAIIAEGRRFGLGLTLSHQNLSQLPQGLRQALRNNVHTQLYFQTGATDASDLAREVGSDASREDIRAALMAQKVGEAFLIRRGDASCRVRIPRSPDPTVDAPMVWALREVARNSFGHPRAEAEAELSEREAARSRLREAHAAGNADTTFSPSYEVRHAKTGRFHPRPPRQV